MTNRASSEQIQIICSIAGAHSILAGQKEVLGLLAKGAPLFDILYRLIQILEQQTVGLNCQILLLDQDTKFFKASIKTSSPHDYSYDIAGSKASIPYLGPCCMAADLGKTIIVDNILEDTRWPLNWRQETFAAGFKSCQSHPIICSTGSILGTFVMYHRELESSNLENIYQTEVTCHLAAIAMERKHLSYVSKDNLEQQQRVNEELKHALALRDEFLSIASHELSSPLATLKMQCELLRWDLSEDVEIPKQSLMELMIRQENRIDRVLQMVNTMLDLSRFANGNSVMNLKSISLKAIVQDTCERLLPYLNENRVSVDLSGLADLLANCDPFRMEQVFTNLITNAVKYGSGRPVQVAGEIRDSKIYVEVRDQGIGIAPEDQGRIFNRYERLENQVGNIKGFGLGLHIVKEIINSHGGEVGVTSRLGEGSVFYFTLPISLLERDQTEPVLNDHI